MLIYFIRESNLSNEKTNLSCSSYMIQLQQQISQFQSVILSKFIPPTNITNQNLNNNQWLKTFIHNLCSRILYLFIRHISLVRPLSEYGKLKLANDMAQIEFAIDILIPLNQLGNKFCYNINV